MRITSICLLAATAALPAAASETRQLGAHEHGTGSLTIAVEGTRLAMGLEAPGADIVGFEHAATSDEDRALVETALEDLSRPLDWFAMPASAGCAVVSASVALIDEDGEVLDEYGHAEAAEDHDHEHEHAEEDGHDHDQGTEKTAAADHDHDHGHAAGHTEIQAEYLLDCRDPDRIDGMTFPYFARFPNALELEVQVVSDSGGRAYEVERDAPSLDLRGLF